MTSSKNINAFDNKIEQSKAQYNLEEQFAKISSGNIGKIEFLTGKNISTKKGWLVKAVTIKRFEYSPLDSKLKETK